MKRFIILLGAAMLLASCATTKNIIYFQDIAPEQSTTGEGVSQAAAMTTFTPQQPAPIVLQADDKISIIVNTRDPQLTALFNLPYVTRTIGQASLTGVTGNTSYNQGMVGYTVAPDGTIDFPILGKLQVAGMTRTQLADYIKTRLISENLVKDPVVTVEFLNLSISVLGEVNNPGRFSIDRDQLTILEALSMAGDLTIFGNRTKVLVLREEDGVQQAYGINLTLGSDVYSSPAYYLQQNDIIYVEPNDMRARQSTVNGNTVRSSSFWFSVVSMVTSIAVLLLN